ASFLICCVMVVVPDGQPARRRNFHHVTTKSAALYLGESGAKAQSQTAGSQAFRLSVSVGFKVHAVSLRNRADRICSAARMLPARRAVSAQTEIGNMPVKSTSRSIPMPKGS